MSSFSTKMNFSGDKEMAMCPYPKQRWQKRKQH